MYFFLFILALSPKLGITFQERFDDAFIDLLPENDRKNLLDRVARRINLEINSTKTPEKSIEVPESELKRHDAYVQKIINEESYKLKPVLRTFDARHDQSENAINATPKQDIPDDLLKVRGLKKEESGFDLTLRSKNDRARRSINYNSSVSLQNTPLSSQNVPTSRSQYENDYNTSNVENASGTQAITEKQIQDSDLNKPLDFNNNPVRTDVTEKPFVSAVTFTDSNIVYINTQQPLTNDSKIIGSVDSSSLTRNEPLLEVKQSNYSAQGSSRTDPSVSLDSFNQKIDLNSTGTPRGNEQPDVSTTFTEAITEESSKAPVNETSSLAPEQLSSIGLNSSSVNETANNTQVEAVTDAPVNPAAAESTTKFEYEYPTTVTVIIPLNTSDNEHKGSETEVKQGYNEQEKLINFSNNVIQEYKVSEVEPEASIARENEKDKGIPANPYYAPVYNYDPKNAYFNAYNRYGPNYASDINLLERSTPSPDGFTLLRSMSANNSQDRLGPNTDTFAMDYYFGRTTSNETIDNESNISVNFKSNKSYNGSKLTLILNNQVYKEEFFYGNESDKALNKLQEIIKKNEGNDIVVTFNNVKKVKSLFDHDGQANNVFDNDSHLQVIPILTTTGRPEDKIPETDSNTEYLIPLNKYNDDQENVAENNLDGKRIQLGNLIIVLKDMIKMDNSKLAQYDWLGTTVDIQSALRKLDDLISRINHDLKINAPDLHLMKLLLHLYKTTTYELKGHSDDDEYNGRKETQVVAAPRPKLRFPKPFTSGKRKNAVMLINKLWKRLRSNNNAETRRKYDDENDLHRFKHFVNELASSLHNFHSAIKHISMVTDYRNQNWYNNLKDLYLKHANKKELLIVLLHIYTTNMLEQLEKCVQKHKDQNFEEFLVQQDDEISRLLNEFEHLMKILNKIKSSG